MTGHPEKEETFPSKILLDFDFVQITFFQHLDRFLTVHPFSKLTCF